MLPSTKGRETKKEVAWRDVKSASTSVHCGENSQLCVGKEITKANAALK